MHHYRCQNANVSTTASERIVDTLELFPHNYQMSHLSSIDRLRMPAKDMTDALQNPYPEVPFASLGDDTIAVLTDLAAIFKLKIRQTPSPTTQAAPAKIVQRPSLAPSSDQIRNSHMPKTSPMCHYLRGWSHLGHYVNHLRGCPPAPRDSRPATCLRTTSEAWTPPTWQSPSEITIGHSSTKPTQSSTQSSEKKWNTRLS
jgi:hypothetical protein